MRPATKLKSKTRFTVTTAVVFAIFCLYTVILAIPYIWGVIVSLKTRYEYMEMPVFSLPEKCSFPTTSKRGKNCRSRERAFQ